MWKPWPNFHFVAGLEGAGVEKNNRFYMQGVYCLAQV